MDDNTNPSESDFQDAFVAEMGGTPEPTEEKPVEEPKVEEPAPKVEEPKVEEPKPEEPAPKAEEAANTEVKDEAEKAAEPKFATKDDVKEALKEYNKETAGRLDQVTTARDAIISNLHPEGIDKNIYDTNGNVIKTAQDIVDRELVNERTGEPFTYDEAASFMLEAGQKMSQNIEELNNWAEKVAEENVNLLESNQRVIEKWGDTLATLPPETVKQLANTYITKQLTFNDGQDYITNMAMTPEEFYDTVMAPYTQLAASIKSEQAAVTETKKSVQAERTGLPPQRGQSDTPSNTGDPMLDALVDELNKG